MNIDSPRANRYLAAWSDSLGELLSQLGGSTWECQVAAALADGPFVVAASIRSPKLPGSQTVLVAASDLAQLLSLFLGEPTAIAENPDATQREALGELLRQWCGLAATALKTDFGDVSFAVAEEDCGVRGRKELFLIRASYESRSIAVGVTFDSALQNFLSVLEAPAAVASSGSAAAIATPIPPSPESKNRIDELLRGGNLELLMDVELPVMLRFGCREATLREVLDMATGAVLELDREIQDPVDLVLNGRIIARGEVVVIDGDFGLRVTEVATPQQRVNSFTSA